MDGEQAGPEAGALGVAARGASTQAGEAARGPRGRRVVTRDWRTAKP